MKKQLIVVFSLLYGLGVGQQLCAQENKGTCLSGNCNRGYGVMLYSDGKYEGEFFGGKRNGYGTYTFTNGKKMEGMWENGKIFQGTNGTATPYQPDYQDKTDKKGEKVARDKDPFVAALYELVAAAPDRFKTLRADSIDIEYNKYEVWKPTVSLPDAQSAKIRQFNETCVFVFGTSLTELEAKRMFEELAGKVQSANIGNLWSFEDISANPALPLHTKFYKWTILNPATIWLEWKKENVEDVLYSVTLTVVK